MSRFRQEKKRLLSELNSENWEQLCDPVSAEEALGLIGPLLAMLPREDLHWRAAHCLGKVVAALARFDREAARNLMRRLMWSLNEESGNLGWGIPETMACIIAQSPLVAKEYERIAISYVIDTGKSSNYIDHAPLRKGAYWGIGHMARNRKEALWQALPHLLAGLEKDEDMACKGMAAWAVGQLAGWYTAHGRSPEFQQLPMWSQVDTALQALDGVQENIEIFESLQPVTISCTDAARQARQAIAQLV